LRASDSLFHLARFASTTHELIPISFHRGRGFACI
jgi:hypothetical protein